MKPINRIKAVLAENGKTNKWLAETLGKDQTTVSKWCTNTSQPDLKTLTQIAELLGVQPGELLMKLKNN
ncbi:MAG: helix-turn-helix transcriptional regulator [Phocaeicola sp.]